MNHTTVLQNSTKTPLKLLIPGSFHTKNDPRRGRFNAKKRTKLLYLKIHFHCDTGGLPSTRGIECSTPRIGLAGVVT